MKITCCRKKSPGHPIIPNIYCCNLVGETVRQALSDVNAVPLPESTL